MPSHIERRSTNQCRTGAVPIAVAALALGLLFAAPASAGKKTDTLGMAYDVFMQMNTLDGAPNPVFKAIRVRKAIAHAIDREARGDRQLPAGPLTVMAGLYWDLGDGGTPHYGKDAGVDTP